MTEFEFTQAVLDIANGRYCHVAIGHCFRDGKILGDVSMGNGFTAYIDGTIHVYGADPKKVIARLKEEDAKVKLEAQEPCQQ